MQVYAYYSTTPTFTYFLMFILLLQQFDFENIEHNYILKEIYIFQIEIINIYNQK
jgi:hypothetical protein